MKISSILAALVISAATAFAQTETSSFDYTWGIDQHRYSYGFLVTRLQGINTKSRITNIKYTSCDSAMAVRIKRAEENMEPDSSTRNYCRLIKTYAPGGIITVLMRRPTLDWGNQKNIVVVVKDSLDDKILYRETGQDKWPDYDSYDGVDSPYLTIYTVFLEKNYGETFYVYVLDTYGTTERFRFKVQRPIK